MIQNPYKYLVPLDAQLDGRIYIERTRTMNKLIENIEKGSYVAIIGPSFSGKTTLLRNIQNSYPHPYYLYFDMQTFSSLEPEIFYRQMMTAFIENIPSNLKKNSLNNFKTFDIQNEFVAFLKQFKPKKEAKIVLLIDNIERFPFHSSFLKVFRFIFSERDRYPSLKKYTLVISGKFEPTTLITGPTSPFNIVEKIYLEDLTEEESRQLIEISISNLGISIEPQAKNVIYEQTSGHPQLLQHLCHILVENAILNESLLIGLNDVMTAIDTLIKSNQVLALLKKELSEDNSLRLLITDIILGKTRKFFPFSHYSHNGTGPIIEKFYNCAIRNKLFEQIIKDT